MNLAPKVRMLRESQGMTQPDLADAAGISKGAVNKLEREKLEPLIGTVVRIAEVFEVPVEFLLDASWPCPHQPDAWRKRLPRGKEEKGKKTRMTITREERAFLERLRAMPEKHRRLAHAVPGLGLEMLWAWYRVVMRATGPS